MPHPPDPCCENCALGQERRPHPLKKDGSLGAVCIARTADGRQKNTVTALSTWCEQWRPAQGCAAALPAPAPAARGAGPARAASPASGPHVVPGEPPAPPRPRPRSHRLGWRRFLKE